MMDEEEFLRRAKEFGDREKALDGECRHLAGQGVFTKDAMEKCGFLHMAGEHGKTRIVIEYDSDAGTGVDAGCQGVLGRTLRGGEEDGRSWQRA